MKLYGVYTPKNVLKGVFHYETDARALVFNLHPDTFRYRYWHKCTASWRAAKKEGWKIIVGKFVPLRKR